jgi:hypothetical protein
MTKALKFARLDFITVKPYLTYKNILIFIAVALIMIYTSSASENAIGIIMVFATIFASYPFSIGEKNDIDALYVTLSINRGAVVLGRYLYALIIDILSGFFAYALSFAVLSALGKGFDAAGSMTALIIISAVFSIIQAIQMPVYFKLGYNKAKFLIYIPLIAFPMIIAVLSGILKDIVSLAQVEAALEWAAANMLPAALAAALIWIVIMAVSVKLSLAFYKKRDF